MASMTSSIIAVLLLGLASADDTKLSTNIMGSMYYHDEPQYNSAKTTGTVIGWVIFCLLLVIAGAMIIGEAIQRHQGFQATIAK